MLSAKGTTGSTRYPPLSSRLSTSTQEAAPLNKRSARRGTTPTGARLGMLYLDCFLISLPPQKRWDIQQILGIDFGAQSVAHRALPLHGRLVQHRIVGR